MVKRLLISAFVAIIAFSFVGAVEVSQVETYQVDTVYDDNDKDEKALNVASMDSFSVFSGRRHVTLEREKPSGFKMNRNPHQTKLPKLHLSAYSDRPNSGFG